MKKIDLLKKKLAFLTLAGSLALTGCSSKKSEDINPTGILVECTDHHNSELSNARLDDIMGLKNTADEDHYGEKLNYNYIIDNTNITKEDLADKYIKANKNSLIPSVVFARLVDEETITDKLNIGDGKKAMSLGTFKSGLQILNCPGSLRKFKIPHSCMNFEINAKKLVSIEGQTFYNIKSTVTFNDNVVYYNKPVSVEPGKKIECECLFQLFEDGTFVEISRNQTGVGCEDKNIASLNFNNKAPVVLKVEDTVFRNMNGEYKKSYLEEAADTYAGTDEFYSKENEGIDFSQYKRVLKKED